MSRHKGILATTATVALLALSPAGWAQTAATDQETPSSTGTSAAGTAAAETATGTAATGSGASGDAQTGGTRIGQAIEQADAPTRAETDARGQGASDAQVGGTPIEQAIDQADGASKGKTDAAGANAESRSAYGPGLRPPQPRVRPGGDLPESFSFDVHGFGSDMFERGFERGYMRGMRDAYSDAGARWDDRVERWRESRNRNGYDATDRRGRMWDGDSSRDWQRGAQMREHMRSCDGDRECIGRMMERFDGRMDRGSMWSEMDDGAWEHRRRMLSSDEAASRGRGWDDDDRSGANTRMWTGGDMPSRSRMWDDERGERGSRMWDDERGERSSPGYAGRTWNDDDMMGRDRDRRSEMRGAQDDAQASMGRGGTVIMLPPGADIDELIRRLQQVQSRNQ